jgi:hypothetical protein
MSLMAKRFVCVPLLWLSACATTTPTAPTPAAASAGPSAPESALLVRYVDTLAKMAPGDTERQLTEIATARASAQQTRRSADVLRYAIALGSAGHPASNPVEAKRLITELLAGPNDLATTEVDFASALLREFDARVALYAELARLREEAERQLVSPNADADHRAAALAAENKALRRALAEAERKLEAVAEMERSLLEQSTGPGGDTQR